MSVPVISNQDLANSIDELKALMLAGFENVNACFDRLEERVERLEERMDRLEKRMDGLESRMDTLEVAQSETHKRLGTLEAAQRETHARLDALEVAQRETNVRLSRIEGALEAHYADIKELYRMIADVKKRFGKQLKEREDLNERVHKVEIFAREVSMQTGIPYPQD